MIDTLRHFSIARHVQPIHGTHRLVELIGHYPCSSVPIQVSSSFQKSFRSLKRHPMSSYRKHSCSLGVRGYINDSIMHSCACPVRATCSWIQYGEKTIQRCCLCCRTDWKTQGLLTIRVRIQNTPMMNTTRCC